MYIFFHVPKTAGTSIRRVLEGWFPIHLSNNVLGAIERRTLDIFNDDVCISGHIGGRVFKVSGESLIFNYPFIIGKPIVKVFTFIRDPAEQAISFYFHQRKQGLINSSFDNWISIRHNFCYRKVFCGPNIDRILSSFFFIGITDIIQISMDHLAELVSRPQTTVPKLNSMFDHGNEFSISSGQRKKLERLYEWEFELYEKCRDLIVTPSVNRNYDPNLQFIDFKMSRPTDTSPPVLNSGFENSPAVASLISVSLHNKAGVVKSHFLPDEAIGITIAFDIENKFLQIEPTLAIGSLTGEIVFVVAFVDSSGCDTDFDIGRSTTTAWIPANLLNSGRYTLTSTLSDPFSRTTIASMTTPIVFEVLDNPCPARGKWVSPFPGPIRPLITWQTFPGCEKCRRSRNNVPKAVTKSVPPSRG